MFKYTASDPVGRLLYILQVEANPSDASYLEANFLSLWKLTIRHDMPGDTLLWMS